MSDQIDKGFRDKPLAFEWPSNLSDVKEFLNRELIPVVSQLRAIVNRRFGRDVEVSSDYEVQLRDETLFINATTTLTITLPAAESWRRTLYLVLIDGSSYTLAPASGELLDGASGSTVISANTVLRPDNTRPGFWRM